MSVLLPIICRRARSSILFNSKHQFILSRNFVLHSSENYYTSFFDRITCEGNSKIKIYSFSSICTRNFTNNVENNPNPPKVGLVAQFKQMYKDYWYVLVPVHLVTSAFWFGSFYYVAKSGVDVVSLLNTLGVSEKYSDTLKDSSMGYFALAYALYKVFTPLRYTVTIGGTTISIRYLTKLGYIQPMPSRQELKEMYNEKKEGLQDMYQETKQELRQRKDQIRERKEHVMGDIARYKQEIREIKENELKNK